MPTLYIETSIVSYLNQRPSAQVITAARQLLTHRWWTEERAKYELVTSQYVIDEASAGDPELASQRLTALEGIPLLEIDSAATDLAERILQETVLPRVAAIDAFHIALAAHHEVEYMLTWNCKHIANAVIMPRLHRVLEQSGAFVPIICTPQELVQHEEDEPNP
jgi:hypothetical protein